MIDGHWATVGSSNIDPFSLLLAREANVVIDGEPLGATLAGRLKKDHGDGWSADLGGQWKQQPAGLRFISWLSYGLL